MASGFALMASIMALCKGIRNAGGVGIPSLPGVPTLHPVPILVSNAMEAIVVLVLLHL